MWRTTCTVHIAHPISLDLCEFVYAETRDSMKMSSWRAMSERLPSHRTSTICKSNNVYRRRRKKIISLPLSIHSSIPSIGVPCAPFTARTFTSISNRCQQNFRNEFCSSRDSGIWFVRVFFFFFFFFLLVDKCVRTARLRGKSVFYSLTITVRFCIIAASCNGNREIATMQHVTRTQQTHTSINSSTQAHTERKRERPAAIAVLAYTKATE